MTAFIIICAIAGAISLINFILYGKDKFAAIKGTWRVPEITLILLSLLGGAVGGILGMMIFHHKFRKPAFIAANVAGLAWQGFAQVLAYLYLAA